MACLMFTMLQVALNEATATTSTLKSLKRLKGHTSSVQCVAASPSGSQVLDHEYKGLFPERWFVTFYFKLSIRFLYFAVTVHFSDDREVSDYRPCQT